MASEIFRRKVVGNVPDVVLAKWGKHARRVLREGFVPFPKTFLRTLPQLFPNTGAAIELAVILAIVDFRRLHQSLHPSVDYLAFMAGLSREQFTQTLSKLTEKGWVHVQEIGDRIDINIDGLTALIGDLATEPQDAEGDEG